jgi:predicted nucleic acid-binding protein
VTHGLDTSFLLAVEIVEHAHHAEALRLLGELLARGDRVAIAPQVLTEFVHVVTDERRFQQPFSMETALNKSERWWNAAEADQVLPTDVAIALFHTWMRRHQLEAEARARHIARCDVPRSGSHVASDVERGGFHGF